MSTTTNSVDAIIQEITIKASATRVFEALVDPTQRMKWWGQKGRFETTNAESDLRPGGRWIMSGMGMGKPFKVEGVYRIIERPRVLARSPGCRLGTRKRPRRWCGLILLNRRASPRSA